MHRQFIALIVTTAIVVTGFTAIPARAGGDDVAKALAGLAAIMIIGAAISNSSSNAAPMPAPTPVPTPTRIMPPLHHVTPRTPSRYVLPGQCERRIRTNNGYKTILGANCLAKKYSRTRSLPRTCVTNFWNEKKDRLGTGYAEPCLRRYGYQIARY
jgi:hypothetical protein